MLPSKTEYDAVSLALLDVYPIRVDWHGIADDLRRLRRMGYASQARALGIPKISFQRYVYGNSRPKFELGHAWLVLHARVCGKDLTLARLNSD